MEISAKEIKEAYEAFEKASVSAKKLLKTINKQTEFMQIEYLAKRTIGSSLMEDFIPLPIFRDWMNGIYGTSNSSRRYASFFKQRGFRQSAKRVGSTTMVGYLFKFMNPEDKASFEIFSNKFKVLNYEKKK